LGREKAYHPYGSGTLHTGRGKGRSVRGKGESEPPLLSLVRRGEKKKEAVRLSVLHVDALRGRGGISSGRGRGERALSDQHYSSHFRRGKEG